MVATRWHRDPLIWMGVAVTVLASTYTFFAARYLPYMDWAGHVGLASVLTNGVQSGAAQYLARDLTPSPYWSFYVLTALGTWVMPAEVAAKLTLLLTAALLLIGAARLAESTGRNPRLGLIAPLALFGMPLGFGFASYVIATPFLFFVLADLERVLSTKPGPRWDTRLALGLGLAFLGHGLLFGFVALLVGLRMIMFWAQARLSGLRASMGVVLAFIPAALLAAPSVMRRFQKPWVAPEFNTPGGPDLFGTVPLERHLQSLPSDLLDRGGDGHDTTAVLALLVAGVWFLTWVFRPHRVAGAQRSWGVELYAVATTAMFLFGPVWAGWPVTFWIVYQRTAVLAAALIFLLPRPRLDGKWGAMAALAFVPLLHNAAVNAEAIRRFSEPVDAYDEVRALIPPGQRILALKGARPADSLPRHPAYGTLYFYHLADGAAYVPVSNIPEEMPVHRLNAPGTPYNPSSSEYDPAIHGTQYDWLVLRGERLVEKTRDARTHEEIARIQGWVVFKTKR